MLLRLNELMSAWKNGPKCGLGVGNRGEMGEEGVLRNHGEHSQELNWCLSLSLWFSVGGADALHLSVGGPGREETTSSSPH